MEPERLSQVLSSLLSRGGSFADIFLEETELTSILCEDDKIEHIVSGREQGAGLRLIKDFQTFYASTTDLRLARLQELARSLADQPPTFDPAPPLPPLEPEPAPWSHSLRISPEEVSLEEKVRMVMRANAAARSVDPRIRQVKVSYREGFRRLCIVHSQGRFCQEERPGLLFAVQVVAAQDGLIQTGYEVAGGTVGMEIFAESPPEAVAEKAARRAVQMLQAAPAPAGPMTVVLSSEAGGTMIHEAVGHGLESDLAREGLSVYSGRRGEAIASPLITVVDDPTLPGRRGSYVFDDEGCPSRRTVLIEKGVLRDYLYDRLHALKDGRDSTGHGRRQSFQHRPLPRMSNTLILPGSTDPAEIVRSVSSGLLVKKMGGGQVNTVNGDFVFEVSEGYRIENGQVGEPVRGATLIGNGPRILQEIDMVGSDLGFGLGTCGKDGQGAPVSDGQPTLRLPRIIVGGVGGSGLSI